MAWSPLSPVFDRTLVFAPLAWLKLQCLCHLADTEIGGFGISREGEPLYIEDFVTIAQQCTPFSVRFEDEAIADFFDQSVDRGLTPDRFARIWCHTHPGSSVTPSGTDEGTFVRCFGSCDWAIMFILGRTGLTYARMRFASGPGVSVELPVRVDWAALPDQFDEVLEGIQAFFAEWIEEFNAHVRYAPEEQIVEVAKTSPAAPAPEAETTAWESWSTDLYWGQDRGYDYRDDPYDFRNDGYDIHGEPEFAYSQGYHDDYYDFYR